MFTVESVWVVLGLAAFAAVVWGLVLLRKRRVSFSIRVAAALGLGIVFGVALQLIFGAETASGAGASLRKWINIPAVLFTRSLQLLVAPLVLVSITNAIMKFSSSRDGIKNAGRIISFLLITTAFSAVISMITTRVFNLSASHLIDYQEATSKPADIAATLINLIPSNLFAALSGNSVLPVVFVAALFGAAALSFKTDAAKKGKENVSSGNMALVGERLEKLLTLAHDWVLRVVRIVIRFTPYGVLSIITVRAASGSGHFIMQLALVIAASFVALGLVFLMHLVIASVKGISPIAYLQATAAALLFALSSRSSAATVPLTIEAQRRLGVEEGGANLAAALGTCIGQNGCAGVYPTMIAILVGLSLGWNVWSISFLAPLLLYVLIASIGTAGVGGGATNVSLLVLSMMGLPVELVAILVSVDFIIDMGRTAVNVSDSILAGCVCARSEVPAPAPVVVQQT